MSVAKRASGGAPRMAIWKATLLIIPIAGLAIAIAGLLLGLAMASHPIWVGVQSLGAQNTAIFRQVKPVRAGKFYGQLCIMR